MLRVIETDMINTTKQIPPNPLDSPPVGLSCSIDSKPVYCTTQLQVFATCVRILGHEFLNDCLTNERRAVDARIKGTLLFINDRDPLHDSVTGRLGCDWRFMLAKCR